MSKNRTGMVAVDKWHCQACGYQNDPETDRCDNCRCDMDGAAPEEDQIGDFDE